jgi:hypothetical protein
MGQITISDEQTLRAELAADLATIPVAGNVFDRRRKFNSRQDFLQRTQQTIGTGSGKTKEIRFIELELINVEDSPDEGFDDCPVAILTYNLHIFHEFNDGRTDGSNSDTDFNDAIFQLRSKFLSKRKFVSGRVQTDAGITPPGTEFTQFGNDTFTDVTGHFKDLTLKVNYYDEAHE